ncbi:metal ABC transporter substrate-binding protein [Lacticaseibacillus saniviri]|uniref:Manganese ABC transporter substrate-binding protein n=1 Tax=Lacticaseibacillus saniviri JCM 17471 = DSM 24301 TaxID=1293598 RepID=A0A0R2MYC1_9LACO|nr:metal ABC transporter substrate-binding protein [Lacticaseibacillus saniviri]KRO17184.1 manganese ABC transporter substrate-binding protein [Lacticaseibacillus saniviri JCM 17471 = DSM 24301]MCG4281819.1 metal ABC transporter substrate-binding protein [Lacticaseibacillus saniviri]
MKRIFFTFIGVVAMISGLWVYLDQRDNNAQARQESQKLRVVTTNSILEDMVRNVGGDRIALYSIVKRGTDPHEYEPKPTDITATSEADVIFHNGLNLETGGSGWFKKLVETSHKQFGKQVFAASAGVTPQHLTTNTKEVDPHAWLDLANGVQYVKTITKQLQQKDPDNAAYYQKNADRYIAKLEQLHRTAQTKFVAIPESQRLLVTSEGAFKYFSKAYHVTSAYIWEINTESQGTPEQMKAVLAQIRQSEVKHVFVETSVSPKSMEKVAKETGLSIYSKIFTDSLAAEGKQGDTYYDMMKWNLDKIYAGLTTDQS